MWKYFKVAQHDKQTFLWSCASASVCVGVPLPLWISPETALARRRTEAGHLHKDSAVARWNAKRARPLSAAWLSWWPESGAEQTRSRPPEASGSAPQREQNQTGLSLLLCVCVCVYKDNNKTAHQKWSRNFWIALRRLIWYAKNNVLHKLGSCMLPTMRLNKQGLAAVSLQTFIDFIDLCTCIWCMLHGLYVQ